MMFISWCIGFWMGFGLGFCAALLASCLVVKEAGRDVRDEEGDA